ncbi:phage major capsid protein [Gordonia sp. PP30]|uniref:phage major capsid protein n=1 Tax=Gordonia sp. PP30 TaxID=2935861 RepID=UPI001FFF5AC7|nr:phage major capsid protein [Gordonia sp. PP30]UQE75937.1 phage major capsid protein [Gordonia sp. PP30]
MNIREKHDALLKKAQDLIAERKAAGAELSDEDRTALADYKKQIDSLAAQIAKAGEDEAIVAAFSKVTREDGSAVDDEGAKGVLTGRNFKHVASELARKATAHRGEFGVKAMSLTGATNTIVTAFAQQPEKPVELLDVLPVITLGGGGVRGNDAGDLDLTGGGAGPTFRYLRESTRTNNAAPVAPGASKPTSVYGITPVDASLQVIAHLTEEIGKYDLRDVPGLTQFLSTELLYGLRASLEHQIINGTGTAPQLSGIITTSGIQTQAAGTDIALTVRSSITKLESLGHVPSAVVLSPADWEKVETSTASGSGEFLFNSSPVDRAARTLWGVPVVCSTSLPANKALLLSHESIVVYTDGALDLEWEQGGELFEKNQLRARFESRFQTAVLRPQGIVYASLPTAGG